MLKKFDHIESSLGEHGNTALSSSIVLIIIFLCMLTLIHNLYQDAYDKYIAYLVVILGSLIGWIFGIIAYPYDEHEDKRFLTLTKAISVFLSGYAISKIDRYIESALFIEKSIPKTSSWVIVLIFFSSVLIFSILIFSNRAYFRRTWRKSFMETTPGDQIG